MVNYKTLTDGSADKAKVTFVLCHNFTYTLNIPVKLTSVRLEVHHFTKALSYIVSIATDLWMELKLHSDQIR